MHCATEYINIHLYINKKKIKEEKDLLNASSSGSKDRRLSEVTHYTAVCRRTPFRTSIVEYRRLYFFPQKREKNKWKQPRSDGQALSRATIPCHCSLIVDVVCQR